MFLINQSAIEKVLDKNLFFDIFFYIIEPIIPFFFISKNAVPDGPPTEARVTHADSRNMSLVWQPPALELRNGEIVNYTICIRFFSTSPGPCLQEVTLGNQTHYKATQLKPYTEYIITIFAGTEIGFGPPVMVVNTTSEAGKCNK